MAQVERVKSKVVHNEVGMLGRGQNTCGLYVSLRTRILLLKAKRGLCMFLRNRVTLLDLHLRMSSAKSWRMNLKENR